MNANNVLKENKLESRFSIFTRRLEILCVRHPSYMVLLTWISILSLSFLKDYLDIPETYFSYKDNFFNQIFVKWGWAWTLFIPGSYMIVTSYVYGGKTWKKCLFFALLRLFVGTCFWYFWVNVVFHFVENITGVCFDGNNNPNFNITNKFNCKSLKNGSLWLGFDISGHSFLLTYSLLFINSEIQVQKYWPIISETTITSKFSSNLSKTVSVIKRRLSTAFWLINVLFVLSCLLMFIWVLMLVATCLYFHTFYAKALGASCGIASWMVTYNKWYKKKLSPGLPGSSHLHKVLLKNSIKSE